MTRVQTDKECQGNGLGRSRAVLLVLTALLLIPGCATAEGPGIYGLSAEGVKFEIEIPAEPNDGLVAEIVEYAEDMGTAEMLTWARVRASNTSDEERYLCDPVVLDGSGVRVPTNSLRDLVTEAQDTVPIIGAPEDYNRGVDLYNRTLDINSTSLLPGEATEYYVAYSGEVTGPSAVFGGATVAFGLSGCDEKAKRIG